MLISVSDLGYSIGAFFGDPDDDSSLCTTQAIMISFFELSSVLWTTMIAFTLTTLIKDQTKDVTQLIGRMHAFCWGVPLLLALLPLTTSSYGDSGGWCWIRTSEWGSFWRFLQFYVPLWLAFGYNSIVYFRVQPRIQELLRAAQQQQMQSVDSGNDPSIELAPRGDGRGDAGVAKEEEDMVVAVLPPQQKLDGEGSNNSNRFSRLARIKYYPLVLIFCYAAGSANRILQVFFPPMFWLSVVHTIGASSQGTLNSLVYGLTPAVQQVLLHSRVGCLVRACCCLCGFGSSGEGGDEDETRRLASSPSPNSFSRHAHDRDANMYVSDQDGDDDDNSDNAGAYVEEQDDFPSDQSDFDIVDLLVIGSDED